MRISINGVIAAAAGLSLFAAGSGAVRADILPGVGTPTITTSGGITTFSYNVFVSNTQTLQTGSFFTIYDFNFGTLDPNATVTGAPAGGSFAPTFPLVSPPVVTSTGAVSPNDNPAITNATFTYTGPSVVGGPTAIGTFSLNTSLNGPGVITAFAGSGIDTDTGLVNGNITNTRTPSVGTAPVPEPGMVAFLAVNGVGMAGMMFRARRRIGKRSTAAAA